MASPVPESIGKYKIVGEVARGGMGIVYLAVHPSLKRRVIIKKLTIRGNRSVVERFKREAQILLDLHNPNIVHMFDYFTEGPYNYIVLEYVDGMSLDKLLRKQKVLSPQLAMYIFREACKALSFAHEKGVVHRDIKPGNILISKDGEIKLADFGIASTEVDEDDTLTQSGVTLGTPSYMPPEQFENTRNVDCRADIYSMGIMLYEMLLGKKPYTGGFNPETLLMIQKGKYEAPEKVNRDLPPALCRIIKKTLKTNPRRRYQTVAPLLKKTEQYLKQYNEPAIREDLRQCLVKQPYTEPEFVKVGHAFHVFAGITAAVLLSVSAFYLLWQDGFFKRTFLRKIYTPVSVTLELPESARADSDLPARAFFFIDDNDTVPEIESARRTFYNANSSSGIFSKLLDKFQKKENSSSYKIKELYFKPGNYRMKVVTGSYIWWQTFSVENERLDLKLDFLSRMKRPLNISCRASDKENGRLLENAVFSVLYNGKWSSLDNLPENALSSGSVVKIKAEAAGYKTEYFSLLIEWYQDELFLNAELTK